MADNKASRVAVVLASDSSVTRHGFHTCLRGADVTEIFETATRAGVMQHLDGSKPVVVVIGDGLADVDAVTMIETIRERGGKGFVQIVAVSENAAPETVLAVVEAGIDAFVVAPYDRDAFAERVRLHMARALQGFYEQKRKAYSVQTLR